MEDQALKENITVNSQGGDAQSHSAEGGVFSIDIGLMIWTWVVFVFLFIILAKFAWKPMMDSVKKREQTLRDAVDNARKTKEELENIARRQEEIIRQAEENARVMINGARTKAEDLARIITDKAQGDVEKSMARFKDEMKAEKEKVMNEIKTETVDMVIAASEKLIERDLDDVGHKDFVKKQMDKI
jgi:F-type H+-transporting ATPase subunit b